MNTEQIWKALNDLAQSQGSYGRLVERIEESGHKDEILQDLENMNFADVVDLVLYIES